MMSRSRAVVVAAAMVVAGLVMAACTESVPLQPSVGSAAARGSLDANTPLEATMQFGFPGAGSPFPPPDEHDQSSHAKDRIVPRTVVIDRGGTVTFLSNTIHQVAVYDDGTNPEDIDAGLLTAPGAGCPPVPLIDDPNNRLAVLDSQPCAGGSLAPTYTFDEPGRYLIICTVLPHFAQFDMYAWVVVR